LIEFKPGTTDLEPGLATEWTASEDGKTWLNCETKSSFMMELISMLRRFNVERWWDPKSQFGYRNAGKSYEIWSNLSAVIKEVPNPCCKR